MLISGTNSDKQKHLFNAVNYIYDTKIYTMWTQIQLIALENDLLFTYFVI